MFLVAKVQGYGCFEIKELSTEIIKAVLTFAVVLREQRATGAIVGKWILATCLQANALIFVRDGQAVERGVRPLLKRSINAMQVSCVIHADIQGVDSIRNG